MGSIDEVAASVIAHQAEQVDREAAYPVESLYALRDTGVFGIQVPTRYGGLGLNDRMAAFAVERVARVCSATAAVLLFHFQVVRRTIMHGSEPHREDDLAGFAAGTLLGASAWTEAATGKDKRNLATILSDGPDGWTLTGEKTFCTGLPGAGLVHVLAEARLSGNRCGPTFVRVDTKDAGVRVPDSYPLLGLRGSGTGSLELANVPVAAHDLIGSIGSGAMLMQENHQVCLNPGLLALGIAGAAFEAAFLMSTGQLPDTVDRMSSDAVRSGLASAVIELEAAYLYGARAIANEGSRAGHVLTGQFKLMASGAVQRITRELLETAGSRGFVSSFPLERHFRDAQATSLMGPTSTLINDRIIDHLLQTQDSWRQ